MKRPGTKTLARVAVAASLTLAAFSVALPAAAQDGDGDDEPATLVLRAGDGAPGYSVNEFLPEDITVQTGTTVTWEFPWFEPHTVTTTNIMGDPSAPTHPDATEPIPYTGTEFISSGLIFGNPDTPPAFSINFATPGEYTYICILHPDMIGTVTVVDEGDVDTQDEIDAEADAKYADYLGGLEVLRDQLEGEYPKTSDNGDGTTTHEVYTGGVTEHGDVQQFTPDALDVTQGDTVRWISEVFTPHTVTFNIQNLPDELAAIEDIFAVPPYPPAGGTLEGDEFAHSGIIGTDPTYNGGTSFEITFGSPGTYQYICVLHADQAMVAAVNVQAAETPTPTETPTATPTQTATPTATATATATPTRVVPQPPDTGTGTSGDSGNSTGFAALGLGLVALVIGGGLVTRKALSR